MVENVEALLPWAGCPSGLLNDVGGVRPTPFCNRAHLNLVLDGIDSVMLTAADPVVSTSDDRTRVIVTHF